MDQFEFVPIAHRSNLNLLALQCITRYIRSKYYIVLDTKDWFGKLPQSRLFLDKWESKTDSSTPNVVRRIRKICNVLEYILLDLQERTPECAVSVDAFHI